MASTGDVYRRLPGRRRGLISGASIWMGSDHLLLVKTYWFREEYKRFYLRDIQAIVVAPGARFHVSRPIFILAFLWLFVGGPFLISAPAGFAVVWGVATIALIATWISISVASSCRTRLYTAVSNDDLPSLFRTWTARKFLNQVKPYVDRVQGVVDARWAEAEDSSVGPSVLPRQIAAAPETGKRSHTLVSDLFILSLFVGAAVDFNTLHSHSSWWFRINTGLSLTQLVGAIAVMIQRYRGVLRAAMHRVAVAALALMGVMLYVQTITFSLNGAVTRLASSVNTPPAVAVVHRVADGVAVLLGVLGVAIMLRGRPDDEPDIIED